MSFSRASKPGLKRVFERVHGIKRLIVEVFLAKFVPQMLDRIEFRGVGRQYTKGMTKEQLEKIQKFYTERYGGSKAK